MGVALFVISAGREFSFADEEDMAPQQFSYMTVDMPQERIEAMLGKPKYVFMQVPYQVWYYDHIRGSNGAYLFFEEGKLQKIETYSSQEEKQKTQDESQIESILNPGPYEQAELYYNRAQIQVREDPRDGMSDYKEALKNAETALEDDSLTDYEKKKMALIIDESRAALLEEVEKIPEENDRISYQAHMGFALRYTKAGFLYRLECPARAVRFWKKALLHYQKAFDCITDEEEQTKIENRIRELKTYIERYGD